MKKKFKSKTIVAEKLKKCHVEKSKIKVMTESNFVQGELIYDALG